MSRLGPKPLQTVKLICKGCDKYSEEKSKIVHVIDVYCDGIHMGIKYTWSDFTAPIRCPHYHETKTS